MSLYLGFGRIAIGYANMIYLANILHCESVFLKVIRFFNSDPMFSVVSSIASMPFASSYFQSRISIHK